MDEHTYTSFYCTSCGKHYSVPVYCGNRFCINCSTHRRGRIRRKIIHIIANLSSLPTYQIRFLTLTIPNQTSLAAGACSLVSSFRRLRQRQWWLNKVSGGCYVLEVKGRPGRWHIHLHAIIHSRFLPVRELSKHWSKCSPGRIVHIKNIPIAAVVAYVTGYITKTDLSIPDQIAASKQLKNFRLFQPFGTWQSLALLTPKFKFQCTHCGNAELMHDSAINKGFKDLKPAQVFYFGCERPP